MTPSTVHRPPSTVNRQPSTVNHKEIKQLTHHQIQNRQRHFPLVLVCQDVSDPLNIGSLFRLADAMGVERIYLCGDSPAPPHRRISRTARSAEEFVPFEYASSTAELLITLKAAGHQLVGLEITDESVAIDQFDFTAAAPLALILGAESVGLLPDTLAMLDAAVHIPMYGRNTSLNVVQACAIALYEITQQQLRTGLG